MTVACLTPARQVSQLALFPLAPAPPAAYAQPALLPAPAAGQAPRPPAPPGAYIVVPDQVSFDERLTALDVRGWLSLAKHVHWSGSDNRVWPSYQTVRQGR